MGLTMQRNSLVLMPTLPPVPAGGVGPTDKAHKTAVAFGYIVGKYLDSITPEVLTSFKLGL